MTASTLTVRPASSAGSPSAPGSAQTLGMVIRAEIGRLRGPGGLRRGVVGSALSGIGAGVGLLALQNWAASLAEAHEVTSPDPVVALQAGAFLGVIPLALGAAGEGARRRRSEASLDLALVPDRTRLTTARLVAVAAVAAVALTVTLIACAAVLSAWAGTGSLSQLLAVVGLGGVAGTLTVVFAHALGSMIGTPTAATLSLAAVLIGVPGLGLFGELFLPARVAEVVASLASATPAPLLFSAVDVAGASSFSLHGLVPTVAALSGLLTWSLVTGVLAAVMLHRRT